MSSSQIRPDYTGVTETPGTLVSRQAASMALTRYDLVRRHACGCRVLEIACGSGQGLRLVARDASWVVAGDITAALLQQAQHHNRGVIPLLQFDAHALPFKAGSFDLVQIHEAIYYMAAAPRVFEECRRVLREHGSLIVTSINPAWVDFNPSPHATRYLTAAELEDALLQSFSSVDIRFGFPVKQRTAVDTAVSVIKRIAIRLNLMPKTMGGKTLLKRVFLGSLIRMPSELTPGCAAIDPLVDGPVKSSSMYRIVYAIARA